MSYLLESYKMVIIDYSNQSMEKKHRYLIREKKIKTPEGGKEVKTSPSIREWECIETTNEYYKIKDLVNYQVVKDTSSIFGGGSELVMKTAGEETWIHTGDLLTKYDILEELD